MHFEIGKIILAYKNDKGVVVIIDRMNGAHLLNAYTKYLRRMENGEYSKYKDSVNGLKYELAKRLSAYPLDPNMCEK